MSLLISPSNSTGWGLGTRRLYGGARAYQPPYTVSVRSYYRRPWGTVKRRTPTGLAAIRPLSGRRKKRSRKSVASGPSPSVDAAIATVVRRARRYARKKARRARRGQTPAAISATIERVVRGARRYVKRRDRAISQTIESVVRGARRYARGGRQTAMLRRARKIARVAYAKGHRSGRYRRLPALVV